MKYTCVILLSAWYLLSATSCFAACPSTGAPTGCGNCGWFFWNDKCDWVEVGDHSGQVFKDYTHTDLTTVCAGSNTLNQPYGFTYTIGSTKWSWSSTGTINLASYGTFAATYNSGTNATTVAYNCGGSEAITSGNCGSHHYSSTKWDYAQKGYKKRVYDWHEEEIYDWEGLPYCQTVYDNPHICTPCVGSIATGEEVKGCDFGARTVFVVPAKKTSGCDWP